LLLIAGVPNAATCSRALTLHKAKLIHSENI
jgi:hypothetical protein